MSYAGLVKKLRVLYLIAKAVLKRGPISLQVARLALLQFIPDAILKFLR
jgi:hypothetical protein